MNTAQTGKGLQWVFFNNFSFQLIEFSKKYKEKCVKVIEDALLDTKPLARYLAGLDVQLGIPVSLTSYFFLLPLTYTNFKILRNIGHETIIDWVLARSWIKFK